MRRRRHRRLEGRTHEIDGIHVAVLEPVAHGCHDPLGVVHRGMVAHVDGPGHDLFTAETEVRHPFFSGDMQFGFDPLGAQALHERPRLLDEVRVKTTTQTAVRSQEEDCSPLDLLGATEDRIRVNAVAPGIVPTKFSEALVANEEGREHFKSLTMLRELGRPEEIASVIAFLSSEDASYVTGESVLVAGGMVASRL